MNNTARPAISSSASQFKKVLQAFANGDLPYSDVESHLQRLLNSGASPEELRDVLHRYEAIVRAAAAKVDSDPAGSEPQDGQSAAASIPAPGADARPSERSPEPIAAAVGARVPMSATISAVAAPRPVTARATAVGGEA